MRFLLTSLFFFPLHAHMRCSVTHPIFSLLLHLFHFHSLPSSILVTLSLASFCTPLLKHCCQLSTALLLSSPLWCSPTFTPSNDALFYSLYWFFSVLLLLFLPPIPSPASDLLFSLSPIFLHPPPNIFLNVSLSLSPFPFTLSDGSIDSLCDDIAQGQPQGRKPL